MERKTIFNYTPHAITFLNPSTEEELCTFPPEPRSIRGVHELGEVAGDLNGTVPVYHVGRYTADTEELETLGLQPRDTVLVSTIGAEHMKDFAKEKGINVLIPGSGPGHCSRGKDGQIKGCYIALKPY